MKRFFLILIAFILLCPCIVQADSGDFDLTFTERELAGTWETKGAVTITGEGDTCTISGKGAKLSDSTLTISKEGVYVLSGTFNGTILVSVGNKDKVQIVLDNAVVTPPDGPAIWVEEADKVFLTVPKGAVSTLADGLEDCDEDAVIFSRADLCLNGKGTLQVEGSRKHGIVSKDDLIVTGLTLNVIASSTALDGKDCVMLHSVTAALTAGSNGIRSDNAEDADRGYVYIQDSTLTIHAGTDGIEAETLLRADNTNMTITVGGGSESASQQRGDDFGGSGGSRGNSSAAADDGSWKALKSAADLEIHGGNYVINSQDDCIHTNGNLFITAGQFTLSSGDDGIHADNELHISGGHFTISKSYEGIEASKLYISDGHFDITSSDDGLNAAGGADGSASADRWGRGMFSNSVGEIVISGGLIHINANGDGIDSNNSIHISGGVTLVSGASASMNAAFDYDGTATVTGGVLIATGGSGMAQSFTSAENQGCMLFNFRGGHANVNIAVVDEKERVVASFTPDTSYSSVVVTAPGLQVGNTYQILLNAEIEGADAYGFAQDAAYANGTYAGTIEMTTLLQGGSGHSFGGGKRGW